MITLRCQSVSRFRPALLMGSRLRWAQARMTRVLGRSADQAGRGRELRQPAAPAAASGVALDVQRPLPRCATNSP